MLLKTSTSTAQVRLHRMRWEDNWEWWISMKLEGYGHGLFQDTIL